MQATPEVKTRPVLPHTFGRPDMAGLTRMQRRGIAKLKRQKGQPSKVERTQSKKRGK
ncbi:hypothetical protein KDJ05_gp60 [Arthrobacter phage Oxynfrius]|uniref:Uncharacterized protein n=1 Tax=Arthrobacter phage Oxynfrius TaxID=1897429 RepID=A0A1I9SE19_9CAUD|nr:hypothetical protein KDJ05_gp60 [Arthrobacter phage Oxynfrius]AOZ65096.1 hypothetical protein SEA_OXYNFRIUS_60 [Arthrobacter phage Oxynfrius]